VAIEQPLKSNEIPDRPWQKIRTDLFQFDDRQYLITVDYYSDFFETDQLHDKKSKEVITKLKSHMARHRIPEIVFSDNGPPFNSKEFVTFATKYEFQHVTSSPLP
jgi:transposase InsO family protein